MNFPEQLFKSYGERKISRADFISHLTRWQKSRGLDYTCRATATRRGLRLHYRGVEAVIAGDSVIWEDGIYICAAGSAKEFKRGVDMQICAAEHGGGDGFHIKG